MLVSLGAAVWQVATQCLATFVQVTHFRRVIRRFVKRQLGQFTVGNRDIEAVTKCFDVFVGQLLGLVHGVLAFTGCAHAKAFDGFDQQHSGLAFVLHRCCVGRIHLLRVVATATQIPNIVIAHLGDHL